jgi:2-methylcitrate dehydratase PrpD
VPEDAVALAKAGTLDCVGVILAGTREHPALIVRGLVQTLGGEPQASLLGTELHSNVMLAALANGTAAHALDFDDTNHPLYGHPSCHLVPALLALGEWTGASGADFLAAYLIGFEIEVRVSRAVNMPHYVAGWHATATLGTLGAAAAAARLLQLDVTATTNALGVAASLAGGLRENFGTDTKPLHAGLAAKNGVLAALLAREGFGAAADGLAGRYGFTSVLNGGETATVEELDPLRFASPWEITEPYGLAIKQFPSCGATHPAIEAAIAAGSSLDPASVEHVRVGISELAPKILVYPRPRSGLEGKFSLEYCVATALLDRRVGLDHFDDATVARADVQALMPKIEAVVDDRVRDETEFATIVEVELADGSRVEERVDVAKGKVVRPLSRDELVAKFEDCAGRALPRERVATTLELLESLESLDSVARVADAVRP